MNKIIWILLIAMCLTASCLNSILVVMDKAGNKTTFSYQQLLRQPLQDFSATKSKNGKVTTEYYTGFSLRDWLAKNGFTDYQTLKLEGADNYMIRQNKADIDTIPAFLALYKDKVALDSTQVRAVFPTLREMYWIWGVNSITLEDFKPMEKPKLLRIMKTEFSHYNLTQDPAPFKDFKGYNLDDILAKSLYVTDGSVVFVCRDGLKSRLEYPKHLKGAVLEETAAGVYNLKSPLIPAGMWLKDVVFIQYGYMGILADNYLDKLGNLYQQLGWFDNPQQSDKWTLRTAKSVSTEYTVKELAGKQLLPGMWLELVY